MSVRHSGELAIRINGDRAAGVAHIPAARLLMGQTLEMATPNELGVATLRKELSDGTIIVAEKIGDINRVTITPPPGGATPKPIRVFDDVVVHAGAAGYTAGVLANPPTILTKLGSGYRAFAAASDSPSYTGSTYAEAFPNVQDSPPDHPYLHVGTAYTVDDRGEALSWTSQPLVVAAPGRNPNSMYGNAVLSVGRVLFNTAQAVGAAAFYEHVLCAGRVGNELFVLVADLRPLEFDPPPASPTQKHDAWASPVYSSEPHPTALLRYVLTTVVDPITNQAYYKVNYGTEAEPGHTIVWSGSLARAYNRWTYHNGEFVSVQLPAEANALFVAGEVATTPSPTAVVFRLTTGGVLSTEDAGDRVFIDRGQALSLVRNSAAQWSWVWPNGTLPALTVSANGWVAHQVLYADLVNNRLAGKRCEYNHPPDVSSFSLAVDVETWVIDAAAVQYVGDINSSTLWTNDRFNTHLLPTLFPAVHALPLAGITAAALVPCGVIAVGDGSVLAEKWAIALAVGSLLTDMAGVQSAPLYSVGGIYTSVDSGDPPYTWEPPVLYGPVLGPGQPAVYDGVRTSCTAVSSQRYLAASVHSGDNAMGTYLTDGDIPALTNNAYPAPFIGPLGAPLLNQPKEKQ